MTTKLKNPATSETAAHSGGDDLRKLRNTGFIAHVDAGKTTVSESVLYFTGETYKIGRVDDGTALLDYMPQERERGITITAAAQNVLWQDHQINIIDTPGHVDFTAEVERSLRVLDGVTVVLDSVAGVQAQSLTVWRQADKHHVPRIVFVNKMDRIGANFEYAVSTLTNRLYANAVPIQIPIGQEADFQGVIDLVEMRAYYYEWTDPSAEVDRSGRLEPREADVPADFLEQANAAREELVAKVAEFDDDLAELYLMGEEVPADMLKASIRKATIELDIFPVLAGAALRHRGTHQLLDAVLDYLPSPMDLPPAVGFEPLHPDKQIERQPNNDEPLSALAFKVISDEHAGRLIFLRVYSGVLRRGMSVYNPSTRGRERIGRLLRMRADVREPVDEAGAGEIVAAIGLKSTKTGHTLCAVNAPVAMAQIDFPEPVLSISIEPESRNDKDKLTATLMKLVDEDPTLILSTDDESGQLLLAGMGELHLEIILDRMKLEYGVSCNRGRPRVAYRETIGTTAEAEGRFVRQTGGRGQYGVCSLRIEPLPRGSGLEFESEITGATLSTEWYSAIEKGFREATASGVVAGYPVVDVKAVLTDGAQHDTDSSELAFLIAGSLAFKAAMHKASPQLLEPIMRQEVVMPAEMLGTVIGDLNSRRAKIQSMETVEPKPGQAGIGSVMAYVPLSETFNYSTDLRSLTSGFGDFNMELDHYGVMPKHVLESLER
ncbi:MAG: elongation factor G [Chloroflexi bacterium]|nr:elongation factor G [Chloroflexota bacterium]MYF78961.1 elongation factor G [Chloroflexota bacterium]MYK60605.1 elongation factor G [Chloroflexota bacterium]